MVEEVQVVEEEPLPPIPPVQHMPQMYHYTPQGEVKPEPVVPQVSTPIPPPPKEDDDSGLYSIRNFSV